MGESIIIESLEFIRDMDFGEEITAVLCYWLNLFLDFLSGPASDPTAPNEPAYPVYDII